MDNVYSYFATITSFQMVFLGKNNVTFLAEIVVFFIHLISFEKREKSSFMLPKLVSIFDKRTAFSKTHMFHLKTITLEIINCSLSAMI